MRWLGALVLAFSFTIQRAFGIWHLSMGKPLVVFHCSIEDNDESIYFLVLFILKF